MVLKVTAPKEERALEQRPAALAGQGGRDEKPRKKKELDLGQGHSIRPHPALPQFVKINTTPLCFPHTEPTASPKTKLCCKILILLCRRKKIFTAPESKQCQ